MKDLIAGVFNIFEILQFLAAYAEQSKSFKRVLKIKFNYNANSASVYILQNTIIVVILDPFKHFVTVLVLFLFFVFLELFIFFPTPVSYSLSYFDKPKTFLWNTWF